MGIAFPDPGRVLPPDFNAGKAEYIYLYCLNLLKASPGEICAFYLEDFDAVQEADLRFIQHQLGVAGFVTSDYHDPRRLIYRGFWAWKKK